jgi:hypothetical protein
MANPPISPIFLPQSSESYFDQNQSDVVIDRPSGRNDREADDCKHSEQRFDKAKLPASFGSKQGHGHHRKA